MSWFSYIILFYKWSWHKSFFFWQLIKNDDLAETQTQCSKSTIGKCWSSHVSTAHSKEILKMSLNREKSNNLIRTSVSWSHKRKSGVFSSGRKICILQDWAENRFSKLEINHSSFKNKHVKLQEFFLWGLTNLHQPQQCHQLYHSNLLP